VTGALTAVIRYKTPYIDCNDNPVLLSFTIGDTVSCNTILGLPAINGMNMIWNVRNAAVCAKGLQGPNNVFSVDMREAQYDFQAAQRDTANDTPASPRPPLRGLWFLHRLAESHQPPFGGPHVHLTGPNRTPMKAAPTLLIDVPSNIWRQKQHNTWSNPDYAENIDEYLLVVKEYGPGLKRTKFGKNLPLMDDVEYWDDKYQSEFDKGIKIGKHCPSGIRTLVSVVIKRYWDNFYKAGACRPIRGFEFLIGTGDTTPACCRFPVYARTNPRSSTSNWNWNYCTAIFGQDTVEGRGDQ
jgi:hypothetical protein